LTSQALGRIHHTSTCGYVFIKQSDSPSKPSSSTLEPMILPRLLIHLADFPYEPCLTCRATNPRALMRFGTINPPLFHRAAQRPSQHHTQDIIQSGKLPPQHTQLPSSFVSPHSTSKYESQHISLSLSPFSYRITSFQGRTRLRTVNNN